MKPRLPPSYDLQDLDSPCGEGVCNQRSVAAPGDGLGTHDRGCMPISQRHQVLQSRFKSVCLHVIGKAAETHVAPTGVD